MKAKKYLLFFLLGYCIYIAIEVTYRGYSFRLMGIAGGLSLAGIGMLEDAGLRRFPLAFQMMLSAVLITAIELYSGMFSLRVLHYRMWDYSARVYLEETILQTSIRRYSMTLYQSSMSSCCFFSISRRSLG